MCTGSPSVLPEPEPTVRIRRRMSSGATVSRLLPVLRPACSSASAWKAWNHSSASSASSSRRRPQRAGGPTRRDQLAELEQPRVLVDHATSPPVSRAVSSASARTAGSAPFDPPTSSPRSCSSAGQRDRGVVRHRQHEQRVRRERCRPHRRRPRSRRRAVTHDGPPVREPRVRRAPLGGLALGHRRDDGVQHRVQGQVVRGAAPGRLPGRRTARGSSPAKARSGARRRAELVFRRPGPARTIPP